MLDFVSSGSVTDVIYALPAIRDLGGGNLFVKQEKNYFVLQRLIENQGYINSFEIYEGQPVDYSFDDVVSIPNLDYNPLAYSYRELVGLPFSKTLKPWLDLPKVNLKNQPEFTVINRSLQYQDDNDSWRERVEREKSKSGTLYFLGFKEEYDSFCRNIDDTIPWLEINDLHDAAVLLNFSRYVITGPGVILSLCQGLGITVEIEINRNRSLSYLL